MNDTEFILFAIAIQFNKTLGTIKLFWQAVPRMNHLSGSYHSLLPLLLLLLPFQWYLSRWPYAMVAAVVDSLDGGVMVVAVVTWRPVVAAICASFCK
jgi:polyferredoxin